MKNFYYIFWVDAIVNFHKHNPNDKKWKQKLLMFNSFIFSLILWTIVVWLKYQNIYSFPLLTISIFPGEILNSVSEYMLEFVLPFILMNYLFIFNKRNYEKLIIKYELSVKNYAFIFCVSVIIISFITVIISGLFWPVWRN